jgi:hypothetical protein
VSCFARPQLAHCIPEVYDNHFLRAARRETPPEAEPSKVRRHACVERAAPVPGAARSRPGKFVFTTTTHVTEAYDACEQLWFAAGRSSSVTQCQGLLIMAMSIASSYAAVYFQSLHSTAK